MLARLMFLGLFLLWPSVTTVVPIAAMPSYVIVTYQEERLVKKRFGEENEELLKTPGRFMPKFR